MKTDPFFQMFSDIIAHGAERSPRGMKTLELEDYRYTLPPYARLMTYPGRKLSLKYIGEEIRWYLRGDRHDLSIAEKAAIWKSTITNGMINSNYGHQIFRRGGVQWAVRNLLADRDTRRAVIPILSEEHCLMGNKDVPCTETIAFRIRDDKLHCTVHMRSQDAVFGAGNDIPFFSLVQEIVLQMLLWGSHVVHLEMGNLTICATSFHAYERHFHLVNNIAAGEEELVQPIEMPQISSPTELRMLLDCKFVQSSAMTNHKLSSWLMGFTEQT